MWSEEMENLPRDFTSQEQQAEHELSEGNLESAIEQYRALLDRARREDRLEAQWGSCINLGQIFLERGQLEEAEEYFATALSVATHLEDPDREFDALIFQSWARIQSLDLQKTRAAIKDLLDVVHLRTRPAGDRVDDAYGLLGLGYSNLGALAAGANFMRLGIESAKQQSSPRLGMWIGNLGINLLTSGDIEGAIENLTDAIRREEQQNTGNKSTWEAGLLSAEAQTKRRTPPVGITKQPSAVAFDALAVRVSMLESVQDKIDLLKAEHSTVETALNDAMEAWPALDAFALLDSAKSTVGRELLWRRRFEHSGLAGLVSGPFDAVMHGLKSSQVAETLARESQRCVIHLYYTRDRDFYALIGYSVGGQPRVERVRIATGYFGHLLYRRLSALIDARRREPLVSISEDLIDLLAEFGDALLPVLTRVECVERILILPYKKLHALPLHALMSRYFKTDALLDRAEVSYSSSLMANIAARSRFGPSAPSEQNLLFAFVDMEALDIPEPLEWSALKALIGEPSWYTLVGRASEMSEDFSDFPFLLWSSHALSDPSDWAASYLGAGRRRHTAYEIMNTWHLNHAEMAILSGCETGAERSTDDAVDEYLGLDAAVNIAGARSVVSTLWPVEEHLAAITSLLLVIGVLFRRESPSQALRRAQFDLLSGKWRSYLVDIYSELRDQRPGVRGEARRTLEMLLDIDAESFSDIMDFAAYRSFGAG
ncbi:tetratricopeptide (TPR) repeat protein [Geodermatophilus bullaregiensis]|uniref:CHAT domain-containing protein n=1 Tax=Geodermatophilus bullaregiensis TaxID=1564160 RepID=UPI00195C33E4|nr:CHAT domain-containing protein [Geodermatophilus bullaregiensis]MBM7804213.1 tetratricopeptide (TPR) repeat protein [Geodermatophilus bullaregiensis]